MTRVTLLLILSFSVLTQCSPKKEKHYQELKPWQDAGHKALDTTYTSDYMSYRLPRKMEKLNEDWTFNYSPNEEINFSWINPEFDDSEWSAISLPHSYQNYEVTKQVHPYIMNASEEKKSFFKAKGGIGDVKYWYYGWGYYRKHLTLKKKKKSDRIFIEFEGVMKYCKVFLNGNYLGEHKGGFNAFYFDITNHIKEGEDNILSVCVNNRLKDQHRIPPMQSGNQTHSGGIYRDVKLLVKKDVYIPFQGSHQHEGGTFITTPRISKENADVKVLTWIKNDKLTQVITKLITRIVSPQGKNIDQKSIVDTIKMKEIHQFSQRFFQLENPQLWTPEAPNLYKVISEVWVRDELVDVLESPLGFRTFEWDYKDNWGILNGQKIHLHGTNRTQCFPWLNNAIPDWIDVMDMRDIKYGQDHNFIRPNIHANKPLIHDLFDQWGILVNLSSPMIKNIDFNEEVQKQMITEAIRRHRNRPSIVMYSTGNETNDGADSEWIYHEDSTRIISARHVHSGQGRYVTHDHTNMDMENLLRCTVRGWTHNDIFDINPEQNQHTGNEELQHKQARIWGGSQRGRIDMHNGNMWMYCDDGAIRVYKHCPLKWLNPKGWVDSYRVPKYLYFLWQAHYHKEPMVFIHPHYWQEKYLQEEKDIIVDSNCDEVELYANGKSAGILYPNKENFYTVTFKNIKIEQGELKAVARKSDKEIETILPMNGKAVKLQLNTSHNEMPAQRSSIAMITVDARDWDNVQVQAFNKPLKWSISGPGILLAPKVWETDIDKRSADSGVWYITTPVSIPIRSTGEEGTIYVKVECEGLKSDEIRIEASAVDNKSDLLLQPKLFNTGRKEVEWKAALIEDKRSLMAPEMNYIFRDIQLQSGLGLSYYKAYFIKLIGDENPLIKSDQKLVEAIANNFAFHVSKKAGLLVNDDYNFMVDKVNEYLKLQAKIQQSNQPNHKLSAKKNKLLNEIGK